MVHYIYENNKLNNFWDLGFYLYDIDNFEHYQQDVFLFYEYKEHKLLQFSIDDFEIFEKFNFKEIMFFYIFII